MTKNSSRRNRRQQALDDQHYRQQLVDIEREQGVTEAIIQYLADKEFLDYGSAEQLSDLGVPSVHFAMGGYTGWIFRSIAEVDEALWELKETRKLVRAAIAEVQESSQAGTPKRAERGTTNDSDPAGEDRKPDQASGL